MLAGFWGFMILRRIFMTPSHSYGLGEKSNWISAVISAWMMVLLFLFTSSPGLAGEPEIKIAAIFSLTGAAVGSNAPSVQGVRTAVKILIEHLNAHTGVLFVNLNNDYSMVLSEQCKNYFETSGGLILNRLQYNGHVLPDTKKLKPDVVFIPGVVKSGIILREMARAGLTAIPLSGDGWEFNDFFKAGGAQLKRGYYCSHWFRQTSSALIHNYLTHRADKSDVWAGEVLAVDAVNLLAHAMTRSGTTTDRAKIKQSLSEVHGFEGITGTISFDKNGDPIKDVVLMEIRDGIPLFHSRFTPDQEAKSQ